MGAKRAVMGRSQPYDILLAAYQKKNHAKQQKAAIQAGAPPPDEVEANAMPVDSDEETEIIVKVFENYRPRPLVAWREAVGAQGLLVRKKANVIRMREALQGAFKPGMFGAQPQPNGVPGSLNMMDGQQQQGQQQQGGGFFANGRSFFH